MSSLVTNNKLNESSLVSVVIITYNQKQYIKEAVESCLAQTYKNIQVIVSDDSSTDGTIDLLRECYNDHPQVEYIKTPYNQDITANSNLGLSRVKGKYVVIMGGDDLLKPNKIATQVGFLEKHTKCSVCYHPVERVMIDTMKFLGYMGKQMTGGAELLLKYGVINPAVGSMYRVGELPEYGFDERVRVASDWLFTFETLAKNNTCICSLPDAMAYYRISDNNTSSSRHRLGHRDHLISRIIIQEKYPQYEKLAIYSFRRYVFRRRNDFTYSVVNQWFKIDVVYVKYLIASLLHKIGF